MTFTDEESWRPVAGFEGLYEVSSLGNVRSVRRGRLLKQQPHSDGYRQVTMCVGGKNHTRYVHAVVLEAFEGPRPEGCLVRHFPDRCRSNNRRENLSWGSPAQNAADRAHHDTANEGSRNGKSLLTDGAVTLLRWLRADHEASFRDLAEWFGVSRSTIQSADCGRTWPHVLPYGLPTEAAE